MPRERAAVAPPAPRGGVGNPHVGGAVGRAPGEGEGHETEDGEAEEGDGVRPVEELQGDVLHLLLVDHAEVQPVVHVVLAQGPAPHTRRHLALFPSPQLSAASPVAARCDPNQPGRPHRCPLRRRRQEGKRRARSAERRSWRCRSGGGLRPRGEGGKGRGQEQRRGGRGGATPPSEQAEGRTLFCPPPHPQALPPNGFTRVEGGVGRYTRGLGHAGAV